jgi:ATP-dependent RNA helicase DDX35
VSLTSGIPHSSHDYHSLPQNTPRMLLLPLYAGLTTEEQLRVFEPAERGTRKVIVSTNIAEASVTIDGIKFVVDCGFVKVGSSFL